MGKGCSDVVHVYQVNQFWGMKGRGDAGGNQTADRVVLVGA